MKDWQPITEPPKKEDPYPKLDEFLRYSKVMMYGSFNNENWMEFLKRYDSALNECIDELMKEMIKSAKNMVKRLLCLVAYGTIAGFVAGCLLTYFFS